MKIVILAGGMGTRIREETEFKPKPMIPVGEYPIIWHIMKSYSAYGFNDFVVCLGYKGNIIKDYFLNFEVMSSDFTVSLGHKVHHDIELHGSNSEENWKITLADTGLNSMTGARLAKVQKYVDTPLFMMTYGDGVSDIDIGKLVEFHKNHGKIATVTGVFPPSRFGDIISNGDKVTKFAEKAQAGTGCINGGFFVFDQRVFDYVNEDESCIFERKPMEKLAADGELMLYRHEGFWQCMDTVRDMKLLSDLWEDENAPWKIWK